MSQVVKHVCDKCNKEITNPVDRGAIYLSYYNSLASSRTFEADICSDCTSKIVDALKAALKSMFKDTDEAVAELDTFFSRESALIEQMKKEEESMAAAADNSGLMEEEIVEE